MIRLAIAIFAFAALVAGGLLLSEVAWPVGGIVFEVCSGKTCKAAFSGNQGTLRIEEVEHAYISESPHCPGVCSQVSFGGQPLNVVGAPADVACKLWGGPDCVDKGK